MGSWNVCTLVESSGDRCAGRVTLCESSGVMDRKLDLVVKELKRYGLSVAGIQESKWFGSNVWKAGGYTFLHSGRPLPGENDRATRNEGVGIAIDDKATSAWKNVYSILCFSVKLLHHSRWALCSWGIGTQH